MDYAMRAHLFFLFTPKMRMNIVCCGVLLHIFIHLRFLKIGASNYAKLKYVTKYKSIDKNHLYSNVLLKKTQHLIELLMLLKVFRFQ